MTETIRWDNCEIYINGVKLGALSAFAGQGYQPKQNIDSEHSVPPPKSDGREKAEEVDQNENSYYPVRHELIGEFEKIGVTAYLRHQREKAKIRKRYSPFKGRPGLDWMQYFVKRSDLTHSVKLKWSRAADNDTWYICGFDVHVSMTDQDKSESAKTEELRQQVVIQAERIDALAAENAKLRQENGELDRENSELEKQNQVQQRRITELELAYRHSLDDLICAEVNLSMLRRTHGL